MMTDREAVNTS